MESNAPRGGEHNPDPRKALSDHLADLHGVWVTREQFHRATLDELEQMHDAEHMRDAR